MQQIILSGIAITGVIGIFVIIVAILTAPAAAIVWAIYSLFASQFSWTPLGYWFFYKLCFLFSILIALVGKHDEQKG